MSRISFFFLLLFFLQSCSVRKTADQGPGTQDQSNRIAFYNVENLFDAADDPNNTGDDEFLPSSKKAWTPERYQRKLDNLAKVVEGMGFPDLIGLAEVENSIVLEDFCEKTSLLAQNYDLVHYESPDFRGIDVALIYKKAAFTVKKSKAIKIQFPAGMIPDKPDYTTRDLLVVEGVFANKKQAHIIVAHLPSRSDGEKETEPRRVHVASIIKKETASILDKNPNEIIIVMGDMNDEPSNKSMTESLGAMPLGSSYEAKGLYNCFSSLEKEGMGTYRFRGDWNMLDQIIVSGTIFNGKKSDKNIEAAIYQANWMMYNDEKYGNSPSRTYGGDRYFGGYSDHLPIYIDVRF